MNPRWLKQLKEYAEALVIALVLALFIRTFVVQAFKIPSGSMKETLLIGDHLLVTKFKYGVKAPFTDKVVIPVSDPQRRDVIVFEYPEDTSKDYIKRVVGVPGDVILVRNKELYVNGELQDEPYVRHSSPDIAPQRDNFGPATVPEGKYFVMGDNRDESHDSRFWGFVDREKIVGKALILYWSWDGPMHIRWGRIGSLVE
jgi:signal peptidase I